MKKKIYSFLGALAILVMIPSGFVMAQEESDNLIITQVTDEQFVMPDGAIEMKVVAEVDVKEAKIVSQDGSKLNISFDLTNGGKVQPSVMYSVKVFEVASENDGDFGKLVYEKIYDDIVSLSENDSVHKEIEFIAPSYLSGEYLFVVNSENETGFPYGLNVAGRATLSGNAEEVVWIDSLNCFADVSGELFLTEMGVDIAAGEALRINCDIENRFSNDIKIVPYIEIRERSGFGKIIQSGDLGNGFSDLEAKEERKISVLISEGEERPLSYAVSLGFRDENGDNISNAVKMQYVVRGGSATIKNARLDRDYYAEGDVASIFAYVSGRADSFSGAREGNLEKNDLTLEINVYSGDKACSDTVSRNVSETGDIEMKANIKSDCKNPKLMIIVKDGSGSVLDERNFNIETKDVILKKEIEQEAVVDRFMSAKGVIFSIFIIVFLTAVVTVIIRKRKGVKIIALIVSFGFLWMFGNQDVQAVTLSGDTGHCAVVVSVGINKASYVYGEPVTASAGSIMFDCCNNVNSASASVQWRIDNGSSSTVTSGSASSSSKLGMHDTNITYSGGGSSIKTAPSVAGPHIANFLLYTTNTYGETRVYYGGQGFSVAAPPSVNGSCGSRNTTYAYTATAWPSGSSYCSAGTNNASPSFPSAGSSASWTCVGSNGGSSASCTATRNSAPTNGSCDTSRATTFNSTTTAWPSGSNYCLTGTPDSSPNFPSSGNSVSWTCDGLSGGSNASCSASRNGTCGSNAINYSPSESSWPSTSFCSSGVVSPVSPAFPSVSGSTAWTCSGTACSATRTACVSTYSYSCIITDGDVDYCLNKNNCDQAHAVTRNCSVTDTSCGGTTIQAASVCSSHGVSCDGSSTETCGSCNGSSSNWIEVNP